MLPLQQADICTATQKRNINEWLELPPIYWLYVFLLEEELFSKEVLQKLYENKLSLLDRKYGFKLVDIQEGQ